MKTASNPQKMFRDICLCAWLLSATALSAFGAELPKIDSVPALQHCFDAIVDAPRYTNGDWGIKVASLDTGDTLYEHNVEMPFMPASNAKLYTMALALNRLGPDYRIKTSLYAYSKPDDTGTLKSDLIIYGRGDPTVCGEYYDGDIFKALEPFVAALTNAGVKRIEGDIVGDDSFFRDSAVGSGWGKGVWEATYGAEISALSINSNIIHLHIKPGASNGAPAELSLTPPTSYYTLDNQSKTAPAKTKRTIAFGRTFGVNATTVSNEIALDDPGFTWDLTIHRPAGLFASLMKDALEKNGITVSGNSRNVNWEDRKNQPLNLHTAIELGSVESKPLRDIVRSVEKPSQNLYCDMILAHIGAMNAGDSPLTSEQLGIRELNSFLSGIGVKKGDTSFDEGSGLSSHDHTTPNATVKLLTYMSKQTNFDVYFDALPIAGVDGTLMNRMKGTAAQGKVHAKTGTINRVNSLSGYVTNAAGERLVFCMMWNGHPKKQWASGVEEINNMAAILAGSSLRTEK